MQLADVERFFDRIDVKQRVTPHGNNKTRDMVGCCMCVCRACVCVGGMLRVVGRRCLNLIPKP